MVNLNDIEGSYLGTEFSQEEIENELKSVGAKFETLNYEDLVIKLQNFYQTKKL